MNQTPPMTAEERATAERYVSGLERGARSWPRTRFMLTTGVVFTFLISIHCLHDFWRGATERYDVVERLEGVEMPDHAPPDLWFVTELRRAADLLQVTVQMRMLDVLEGVFGLMLLFSACVVSVIVVTHWGDGPRKTLLAKLARWQLTQWTDDHVNAASGNGAEPS